ncbi:MAG: signal peptidase I [Vicinamibacteria bacterium]|nr:signal peptidase I [Vicinamibacteria bacterium]MBP9946957.1 signal peptidase I [Vicinamibacteria bacterium]
MIDLGRPIEASDLTATATATDRGRKGRRSLRPLYYFLASLVLGLCLTRLFHVTVIFGDSMWPEFSDGDVVLVSALSYRLNPIQAGDAVVLSHPEQPSMLVAKRIFGLPGDVIVSCQGAVVGTAPHQECLPSAKHPLPHAVVGHHYYVLGDNRDRSTDSRVWGDVHRRSIQGKIVFKFWPLLRFGPITHEARPIRHSNPGPGSAPAMTTGLIGLGRSG